MKNIEIIMNNWIKICSLAVIGLVIHGIYLAFSFIGLYFDGQEIFYKYLALGKYTPPYEKQSFGFISLYILFLIPLSYYGWRKIPND